MDVRNIGERNVGEILGSRWVKSEPKGRVRRQGECIPGTERMVVSKSGDAVRKMFDGEENEFTC